MATGRVLTSGRVAVTRGAFTPLSVSATCKLWVRGDKGVTNVSGKASVWADQSGNGNDLTQATAVNRPTITATVSGMNNQAGLTFDGSTSYMVNTAFTLAQPTTWFFITKNTSGAGTQLLTDGITSRQALQMVAADQISPFAGVGFTATLTTGTMLKPMMQITKYNGASSECRVNGGIFDTIGNAGATAITNLTFGVDQSLTAGKFFTGVILECAVYSTSLSTQDITNLENYARMRYANW